MRAGLVLCLCLYSLLLLGGCASQRPVLYPSNAQAERSATAEQAVDHCMRMAEAADLKNDPSLRVAEKTVEDGAVGAVTGAAVGAVTGNAGRGAAAGAAGGSAHGFMRGMFRAREPDPLFKAYVDRCLHERGFDVIGWR